VEGDGYEPKGNIINPQNQSTVDTNFITTRKHFFHTLFLDSNAKINPPDAEHMTRYAIGDPTEAALVSLAQKAAFNTERLNQLYSQLHQYGFDSVRKRMSSVRMIDNQKYLYVKGAPIMLLEKCTQIYDGKRVRKITDEDRRQIEKYIEETSNDAMRNL
jgi:P-type Ca2+ transporter type 2C